MKKLTLILSMMLALIGINANAAMYIVGDAPFGGWNPANAVEMSLLEDGQTYSYEATFPGTYPNECTVWFIFSEGAGDWTAVNAGRYDSGDNSQDLEVFANTEFTPVKGNTNKSFKFVGTAGNNYTITFNPTTKVAKVSGSVVPPTSEIWSVVGEPAALFGEPVWDVNNTDNHMELVDGLYTWSKKNVELPAGNIQFKVIKNHSYGTSYPASNKIHNVTQSGPYDVTITFDPNTHEITCVTTPVGQLVDGYYVVAGTSNVFGSEWNPNDTINNLMVKGQNGIYTLTKTNLELLAGTVVEFKVVANNTWSSAWPNENYKDTIDADGIYTINITFDPQTEEVTYVATKTGDIVVDEDKVFIMGNINDFEFTPNNGVEMTLDETATGKVYNAHINVHNAPDASLGYIGFTRRLALSEEDWNSIAEYRFGPMADEGTENWVMTEALLNVDNELDLEGGTHYSIAIPAGTWDVTVNMTDGTFKINGTWPVIPEPEMVYTLVGDAAVFGNAWDTVDENNANMLVKGEDGIYTWSKEEVTLYNSFDFKVVGDHDYNNYEWPSGMNNITVQLPEGPAIYTVNITFDPEAADSVKLICNLIKTGEAPVVTHTYTIAGTSNLFVENWNPAYEDNDMTLGEDGLYTWTKNDVVLEGNDTIEFKVVMDHNWDNGSWPQNNYQCIINDAGTYDFVITFNPETGNVNLVATKQGVEHTYTVAGEPTEVFGGYWDAANTANDMTLGEDGLYTWSKTIEVTDSMHIELKVVVDHNWDYGSYPDGFNAGYDINEPGNYNLVVTFNPENGYVTITATPAESWMPGDVNHDHEVDVADVSLLIKVALGQSIDTDFYPEQADLDDDPNSIDVGDVSALINLALGKTN